MAASNKDFQRLKRMVKASHPYRKTVLCQLVVAVVVIYFWYSFNEGQFRFKEFFTVFWTVLDQVTKVLPQNTEQGSAGNSYAQAHEAKEMLLGFRNFALIVSPRFPTREPLHLWQKWLIAEE